MSQLLLNILSNVTLPPYPSFFVHFKYIFVTHPTKISSFSITVTPPPMDTACHPPPPQNSERALDHDSLCRKIFILSQSNSLQNWNSVRLKTKDFWRGWKTSPLLHQPKKPVAYRVKVVSNKKLNNFYCPK